MFKLLEGKGAIEPVGWGRRDTTRAISGIATYAAVRAYWPETTFGQTVAYVLAGYYINPAGRVISSMYTEVFSKKTKTLARNHVDPIGSLGEESRDTVSSFRVPV